MKILFYDSLMPKGHFMVNSSFLKAFCKFGFSVDVISRNDLVKDTDCIRLNGWILPKQTQQKRFDEIINYFKLRNYLKKTSYDVIYIASYDICTFMLAFVILFKWRNRIIIQEHNNIDQLSNRVKLSMYKTYMNCVYHFVFEDSFKVYLENIGIKGHKIFVVPHICNDFPIEYRKHKDTVVISVSASNDDKEIMEILENESLKTKLYKNNIKLIIKSKKISYENDNIRVFSGWLENEELASLYNQASHVMLFFPKTYKRRVSAVFMEAISRGKYVISKNIPLIENYKEQYPGICSFYRHTDEVSEILGYDIDCYKHDREQFIHNHCQDTVNQYLYRAITEICKCC